MATTPKMLSNWFDRGVENNQKWMVIICDTFDYEDFPVYFGESQVDDCKKRIREAQHGDNMQQLMEIYDLTASKDLQLVAGTRVMNGP